MDKRQSKTGVVRIRRFKGRMYTQTASGRDNNYVRSDPCHVEASGREDRYTQSGAIPCGNAKWACWSL